MGTTHDVAPASPASPPGSPSAPDRPARRRPGRVCRRALGLTVVPHLPGAHVGAAPALDRLGGGASPLSEVLVVHVQLQRDSHSFSMTDLVLVAGLYLLDPAALITAQVVGVGARAGAAPPSVRHEAGLQPRRSTPWQGCLATHRLRHPRPGHARWPAPGTGWPRWPPSRSPRSPPAPASTRSCGSPRPRSTLRELPRMLALSLPVRARRRRGRPARRRDGRAEPRLPGAARAARRAC